MCLGLFILWLGFIPFIGGFAGFVNFQLGRLVVMTALSGCSGGITALLWTDLMEKHASLESAMTGVLAAMVDIVMLVAIFAEPREGEVPAGTAELSITYLRQAHGDNIHASANVIKRGRQLSLVEVDITDDDDDNRAWQVDLSVGSIRTPTATPTTCTSAAKAHARAAEHMGTNKPYAPKRKDQ